MNVARSRQVLEFSRVDQADPGVEGEPVTWAFDQVRAEPAELRQGLAQIVARPLFPSARPEQRRQMVSGLRTAALNRQVCKQRLRLAVGEIKALALALKRLKSA